MYLRDSSFHSNLYLSLSAQIDRSNVAMTGCSFVNPSATVIAASQSRLDFAGTTVTAGLVAPTIALHQSHLDVRAGCTLTASLVNGAIAGGSGTVDLDPAATLVNAPAQPFSPGIGVVTAALPRTDVIPGPPGGNANGTLSGPGSIGVLLLGAPGAPTAIPGIAHPSWLVPGTEIPLALGALPLTGGYAVPNAPWVQAVTLAWQGAALGPGAVLASNPVACGHY